MKRLALTAIISVAALLPLCAAGQTIQLPQRPQVDRPLRVDPDVIRSIPDNPNLNPNPDQARIREFERSIELAKRSGNTGQYIVAHLNAAKWFVQQDNMAVAERYFSRVGNVARELADPRHLSETYRAISQICGSSRQEEVRTRGRRYAEQALQISAKTGDRADIGKSHHQAGLAAIATSTYDAAQRHFGRAMRYRQLLKDEFGAGRSVAMLAMAIERAAINPDRSFFKPDEPKYIDNAAVRRAIAHYGDAIKLHRSANDGVALGRSLYNLGAIHQNLGDRDRAVRNFEMAIGVIRKAEGDDVASGFSCRTGVRFERNDGEPIQCPTSATGMMSLMTEDVDDELWEQEFDAIDESAESDSDDGIEPAPGEVPLDTEGD